MTETAKDTSEQKQETSPSSKRKRTAASDSPEERRTKRGAVTAAAASSTAKDAMDRPESPPVSPSQALPAYLDQLGRANRGGTGLASMIGDLRVLQQLNAEIDAEDAANASTTAAAALGSMYPAGQAEGAATTNGQTSSKDDSVTADVSPTAAQADTANGTSSSSAGGGAYQSRGKPAVGSEEWHKLRKDNHKEVERRRRETINEGINELAKIVPNCEKNKGAILAQAVQYIQQLKGQATSNIEKWTLEKLLTEQAIAELTTTNEKLKAEVAERDRLLEEARNTIEEKDQALDEHLNTIEAMKKGIVGAKK